MKKVLIVATTSYAGMGPYVSEIVNSFLPEDNILYFFCEYEDHYFEKNVKNNVSAAIIIVNGLSPQLIL